jgi:DNA polymerase III subunit delta'
MSMTLARGSAIIGHARVKAQLAQQHANAILLTGPARVGRRVLAKWYAQLENCRARTDEPCGVCPSCQTFLVGTLSDLLEVGPKEETSTGKKARSSIIPISAISAGHDKAKEYETHVLEWLETGPRARAKFVLIDGAEFMNEAAANALLKTVEEPPHGSRFVFIAEDASAVIPTIVSRSIQIRVPPVGTLEMERALLNLEAELDPDLLSFAAGRPGLLLERDRVRSNLETAHKFVEAVRNDLLEALTIADQLEKRWERDLSPEALRFVLRSQPDAARVGADSALERTVESLERYASPALAFAVMALEWRRAFGSNGR